MSIKEDIQHAMYHYLICVIIVNFSKFFDDVESRRAPFSISYCYENQMPISIFSKLIGTYYLSGPSTLKLLTGLLSV